MHPLAGFKIKNPRIVIDRSKIVDKHGKVDSKKLIMEVEKLSRRLSEEVRMMEMI